MFKIINFIILFLFLFTGSFAQEINSLKINIHKKKTRRFLANLLKKDTIERFKITWERPLTFKVERFHDQGSTVISMDEELITYHNLTWNYITKIDIRDLSIDEKLNQLLINQRHIVLDVFVPIFFEKIWSNEKAKIEKTLFQGETLLKKTYKISARESLEVYKKINSSCVKKTVLNTHPYIIESLYIGCLFLSKNFTVPNKLIKTTKLKHLRSIEEFHLDRILVNEK